MGLFKKKCAYCRSKIDKGREVFRDVRVPGFVGTRKLAFASVEHADSYESEVEEHMRKSKGGSCCG
jgi:hypothetical protein